MVLQAFATELALRFEIIDPFEEIDPLGNVDGDPPDTFTIRAHPEFDLDEQRRRMIEDFGVDPLRVLPGARPTD